MSASIRGHGTAFDDLSAADAELMLSSLLSTLDTIGRIDLDGRAVQQDERSHFLDTLAEYQGRATQPG